MVSFVAHIPTYRACASVAHGYGRRPKGTGMTDLGSPVTVVLKAWTRNDVVRWGLVRVLVVVDYIFGNTNASSLTTSSMHSMATGVHYGYRLERL